MAIVARGVVTVGNNKQVLIDSDAFLALQIRADLLHSQAVKILSNLKQQNLELVTTNVVLNETATVLSKRESHKSAVDFLREAELLTVVFVTEDFERQARQLFCQQDKSRGFSMVDCENAVVMRRLKIDTVFSFDRFYGQQGFSYAS